MRFAYLLPLLAIAGCVPQQPAAPPPPAPRPAPPGPLPPPPSTAQDWIDGPLTPGTWRWQRDSRGSLATFGPAGAEPLLVVRCYLAERLIGLSVPGPAAAGATLLFVTSDGTRAFPAANAAGEPPQAGAETRADDPFLDRIAHSRGRFRVQLSGGPARIIPAWPEFARTIQDCRR